MSILAAILILSASGSAERSMESTDSIAGIVAQCGKGLFDDFRQISESRGSRQGIERFLEAVAKIKPQLTIDGQPRTGPRAWAEAGWRVGSYVADTRSDGSVGLSYRLRIRRYSIATSTAVSDGRVKNVIDAWWTEVIPVGRSTRRIPIHVSIIIRATERGPKTYLLGTATGCADTREFRCGLVRRIAERQAAEQLDAGLRNSLAEIERGGRGFYAGGADIAGVLDGIRLTINLGQRIGR